MASSSTQTKADAKASDSKPEQTQPTQQKPAAADMDHDEFEDFKVESMLFLGFAPPRLTLNR
jgi:hypothetical protein